MASIGIFDTGLLGELAPLLQIEGLGGASWTVTRKSSGDGVTGAVSTGLVGTVTGYVLQEDAISITSGLASATGSASGTNIPYTGYYWIGTSGQNIAIKDVLTSVTDTTIKMLVRTIETYDGLFVCIVERQK